MKKGERRSLVGYKPEEVDKMVEQESLEFKQLYNQYNNELSRLTEENKRLKNEIELARNKTSYYIDYKERIEKILYESHLEACRMMFNTEKNYEDMVKYKTNIIYEQHAKNQKIKSSINKLLDNIRAIIEN